MKKNLTIIVLLFICADTSNAAYKSYGSRTTKSVSISKPYRSTSSNSTSQSTHTQAKKPTYYRAIPNNEPHVVVKKEDNFFWGMFWGAVLFSDHGKTTHVTNEIKQQVATENQGLWEEYQQNLEAIKSSDGDVDTLKARNKEILAIFKQKATEKYIAQFSIDAKEVSSVLLEEKNVTGVSGYTGYTHPRFFAALSGEDHSEPIIDTQSFRRYAKTYQITMTGPEKIDCFKVSLSDPKAATMEQNASGIFVVYNQEFSDYSIGMQFVNKKDPSVVLSKTFNAGAGEITLQPLSSLDNPNKDIATEHVFDNVFHVIPVFAIFIIAFGFIIRVVLKKDDTDTYASSAHTRTPMGHDDTCSDEQASTLENDDQTRSAVKTAKIRPQYYSNKKYRNGR